MPARKARSSPPWGSRRIRCWYLVYQIWLIGGEEPVSAGVFRPAAGRPVIVPVALEFQRYRAVAISVERAPRGAPQPTTTPILSGAI